jgi:hypothetical protein
MRSTQRRLLVLAAIAVLVFVSSRIPVGSTPTPPSSDATGRLSADDLATIHGDIRRLQVANFEVDAETVLALGHPRWIKAIGGRDAVRRELEALRKHKLSVAGKIEFLEVVFRDEPTVLRTAEHELVVVPSVCIYRRPDAQFEAPTFDLAVRRLGKSKWGFIGGSELNEQQTKMLFPDFPSDYRFPREAVRVVGR